MQIRIDLRSVAQRRIRVEVAVERNESAAGEVEFFMPVWTPGSYLVREYARHVTDVVAADGVSGRPLMLEKTAKNRYRAIAPDGCERVLLRYQIYAHSLTVREAWAGEEFAYWNGACTYLWPCGRETEAAEVRVDVPDGWQFFCDRTASGETAFELTDLDQAIDTPCLAVPEHAAVVERFDVHSVPHRFVCAGLAGVELPESLIPDTVAVIEQASAIFGGTLPLEHYTFLALFGESGRGGLEHMHSSTLLAPRTTFAPRRNYEEFVSLIAHEYFHIWNVKRMRPADFAQFDYERENYTRLLWVAEGVTSYYDDHLCLRAGVVDARAYLDTLAGHIRNMDRMPGRHVQSLGDASFDAWVRFYRQDENTRNTTQNYYSNGALASICLDARIRDLTDGARSLDDAIASMYSATVGSGYTFEDVCKHVSDAAGQDLSAGIDTLVNGPFDPDLDAVFEVFGLEPRWKGEDEPHIGVQFRKGMTELATVFDGSPGWRAGLAPGDEILAIAGLRARPATFSTMFSQVARPDVEIEFLIEREGRVFALSVTPSRRDRARVEIRSVANPSERQLRLREGWLGPTSLRLT